jgi:hypothetical protein
MFDQEDPDETTLGKKLRLRPYREPAPTNFAQQRSAAQQQYAAPVSQYVPPAQQPVAPAPQQPAPQQDDSQLIPITEEEFLRWEANQQRSQF